MKKQITMLPFVILLAATALTLNAGVQYVVSNGLVTDNTTRLTWTRCSLLANGRPDESRDCTGAKAGLTWDDAIDACNNLKFNKRTNWRLPNIRELQSVVVQYPTGTELIQHINSNAFPGTAIINSHYWSSSSHINDISRAWTIDFSYGNVQSQPKSAGSSGSPLIYVRCVSGP